MKNTLLELLQYLPFLLVTKNDGGVIKVGISLVEVVKLVLVPLIVATGSVLITLQVMQTKLDYYVIAANKIEAQVTKVCDSLILVSERLAVVETRQRERIEREAIEGKRKIYKD